MKRHPALVPLSHDHHETLVAAPGLVVYSRSLTGDLVPALPGWMIGSLVAGSVLFTLAAAVLPLQT